MTGLSPRASASRYSATPSSTRPSRTRAAARFECASGLLGTRASSLRHSRAASSKRPSFCKAMALSWMAAGSPGDWATADRPRRTFRSIPGITIARTKKKWAAPIEAPPISIRAARLEGEPSAQLDDTAPVFLASLLPEVVVHPHAVREHERQVDRVIREGLGVVEDVVGLDPELELLPALPDAEVLEERE